MDSKSKIESVRESITEFLARKKAAKPVPPRLAACHRRPYGAFLCQIKLAAGSSYEVQASRDFTAWEALDRGQAAEGSVDYVDTTAFHHNYRFYRVLSEGLYSEQVVGFVAINLPPGFAMIANPFLVPDNRLSILLPDLPEETTLSKYDASANKLTEYTYTHGQWSNPETPLGPGEGAILLNPTDKPRTIAFAGELVQGHLVNAIHPGISIRSSLVPKPGILHSELGFPARNGDVIYLFDRDRQKYVIMPYDAREWATCPPRVGVGESFWVEKNSAGNWIQDFTVK